MRFEGQSDVSIEYALKTLDSHARLVVKSSNLTQVDCFERGNISACCKRGVSLTSIGRRKPFVVSIEDKAESEHTYMMAKANA